MYVYVYVVRVRVRVRVCVLNSIDSPRIARYPADTRAYSHARARCLP